MADPGHPDLAFSTSLISSKSIFISFFKSLFRWAREVLMQHSNLKKRRTATCTGIEFGCHPLQTLAVTKIW